ncbi:MAG: hypothetical protein IKI31_04525 [Treponema sp.]|nr:hypothetical protein [Treponema sp.]
MNMDFRNMNEGFAEGEEIFHYYYSHDERVKNAPKIVKDFYEGKSTPPKGFFKILTASPVNRMGLFSIFVFMSVIILFSHTNGKSYQKNVGGMQFSLSSFSFSDEVFVSVSYEKSLKKKIENAEAKIEIYTIDNQNAIVDFYEENVFFDDADESVIIRKKFTDYDIVKVRAVVLFNDETKTLTANVKKQ